MRIAPLRRLTSSEPPSSGRPLRIVDLINLAASAKEMLLDRARDLHRPPDVENWIVCSPPDAGDLRGDGVRHVEAVRRSGIPIELVKTPTRLHPLAIAVYLFRLFRVFRRLRPDIVHTHCSIPGLAGRIAARLAGVPIVIHTVHGFHFHAGSSRLHWAFFSAVERGLAALTDVILTQNHDDLAVIRAWGWPAVRTQMIGNGIHIERYARFARRHAGPGKVVVMIGRFDPVKNQQDLIRVFSRVHDACPEARLRLIGNGALLDDCRRLAAELGVASVTDFLGYRDDVDGLLADADVAALLSWKEGLSKALIEPMAAGIPALTWDVKGNNEVVSHGRTGFVAEAGDLGTTAEHLIQLLRDGDLRRRLGAAAADDMRRRFDHGAFVGRLRSVYSSLLAERGLSVPPALSPLAHEEPRASGALASA
jgi:glycosyltransferase involved in cell wall biosynthesis